MNYAIGNTFILLTALHCGSALSSVDEVKDYDHLGYDSLHPSISALVTDVNQATTIDDLPHGAHLKDSRNDLNWHKKNWIMSMYTGVAADVVRGRCSQHSWDNGNLSTTVFFSGAPQGVSFTYTINKDEIDSLPLDYDRGWLLLLIRTFSTFAFIAGHEGLRTKEELALYNQELEDCTKRIKPRDNLIFLSSFGSELFTLYATKSLPKAIATATYGTDIGPSPERAARGWLMPELEKKTKDQLLLDLLNLHEEKNAVEATVQETKALAVLQQDYMNRTQTEQVIDLAIIAMGLNGFRELPSIIMDYVTISG